MLDQMLMNYPLSLDAVHADKNDGYTLGDLLDAHPIYLSPSQHGQKNSQAHKQANELLTILSKRERCVLRGKLTEGWNNFAAKGGILH